MSNSDAHSSDECFVLKEMTVTFSDWQRVVLAQRESVWHCRLAGNFSAGMQRIYVQWYSRFIYSHIYMCIRVSSWLSACATVRGAARIFLREGKPEIIVKAYTLKTAESTKKWNSQVFSNAGKQMKLKIWEKNQPQMQRNRPTVVDDACSVFVIHQYGIISDSKLM